MSDPLLATLRRARLEVDAKGASDVQLPIGTLVQISERLADIIDSQDEQLNALRAENERLRNTLDGANKTSLVRLASFQERAEKAEGEAVGLVRSNLALRAERDALHAAAKEAADMLAQMASGAETAGADASWFRDVERNIRQALAATTRERDDG